MNLPKVGPRGELRVVSRIWELSTASTWVPRACFVFTITQLSHILLYPQLYWWVEVKCLTHMCKCGLKGSVRDGSCALDSKWFINQNSQGHRHTKRVQKIYQLVYSDKNAACNWAFCQWQHKLQPLQFEYERVCITTTTKRQQYCGVEDKCHVGVCCDYFLWYNIKHAIYCYILSVRWMSQFPKHLSLRIRVNEGALCEGVYLKCMFFYLVL